MEDARIKQGWAIKRTTGDKHTNWLGDAGVMTPRHNWVTTPAQNEDEL